MLPPTKLYPYRLYSFQDNLLTRLFCSTCKIKQISYLITIFSLENLISSGGSPMLPPTKLHNHKLIGSQDNLLTRFVTHTPLHTYTYLTHPYTEKWVHSLGIELKFRWDEKMKNEKTPSIFMSFQRKIMSINTVNLTCV